jgi:hypothetical protein
MDLKANHWVLCHGIPPRILKRPLGVLIKNIPEKDPSNTGISYYLIKFLAKSQEIFFLIPFYPFSIAWPFPRSLRAEGKGGSDQNGLPGGGEPGNQGREEKKKNRNSLFF